MITSQLLSQGDTLSRSFVHNDSMRSYLLYVPDAYDGTEDWPLVINLHGYNLSAEFQMNFSNMNPIADTGHFLIAYPQGTLFTSSVPGIPPQGLGWNVGAETDTAFVSAGNVDDVDFISQLIDSVSSDYQVAADRIYGTGFSNGGIMSYVLACELGDRIAAIASVGGTFSLNRVCSPFRPMPIMQIHGTEDQIVNYSVSDGFLKTVPDVLDFWTALNSCDSVPTITALPDVETSDSSTVELQEWQNCTEELIHMKIIDGGHQWPGGNNLLPFLGHFNLDFNASSEIWNFFKRNPHPKPPGKVIENSFVHDDSTRTYLLYIPNDYDESEKWPLVISYHAYGFSNVDQMNLTQMNKLADSAHFLIAYPQGLIATALPGPGPGWNVDDTLSVNDDVGFTNQMIDEISGAYQIDSSRIYAMGYCMGGGMAFRLTCSLEDRIAAVASVANPMSGPNLDNCSPNRAMSILFMAGTDDPFIPFAAGNGNPVFDAGAFATPAFWTAQNNCSGDSTLTEIDVTPTDSSTVSLIEYSGCDNQMEVLFYRINGGGHTYPGYPVLPPFFGKTNMDIDASAEIWDFFNRNPHPDLFTAIDSELESPLKTVAVYPNPFFGILTVELEVLTNTPVELRLLNVYGQVVDQTSEKEFPAGAQRLQWDVREKHMSSGLYYVQIITNKGQIAKPVLYQTQ